MEKSPARLLYGFSIEDKQKVHERAQGNCEFPGEDCNAPNDNRVHHLSGCNIAELRHLDVSSIRDISTNGMMLCPEHVLDLDGQEAQHRAEIRAGKQKLPYAVEVVIYELDH